MNDFDLDSLQSVSLHNAPIRTGDLLQFRGSGLISSWIRFATHGVHSHSALARVDNLGRVDCLEVRELKGGRAVPLLSEVIKNPNSIDVFRPRYDTFAFDADAAVSKMRELTARGYGYAGIFKLAIQRIPIVWRFSRLRTSDIEQCNETRAPFCSHAVAIACQAGGVDPVPRKPDDLVTPNDLTFSLLFDYLCTLKP